VPKSANPTDFRGALYFGAKAVRSRKSSQAGRLAPAGLKSIRVFAVFNTPGEWPGRDPGLRCEWGKVA
jgi:hypothetical protein